MHKTIHGFVGGKVQGVWFRRFVQTKALLSGVNGWARNLPDGRVEFQLSGPSHQVDKVLTSIHQGPPLARVDEVTTEEQTYQPTPGFSIS